MSDADDWRLSPNSLGRGRGGQHGARLDDPETLSRPTTVADCGRLSVSAVTRRGRYRQMLASARLGGADAFTLPTDQSIGASHLATPGMDERWARRLFERARGVCFYDVVLRSPHLPG